MNVYRLCRAHWVDSVLSGEGARLYGGRWNPAGTPMVYTSSTLSLAALESLVHFSVKTAPEDYVALTIALPDDSIAELPEQDVDDPQQVGVRWVRDQSSLALRVPSAVVPSETNVIINPAHKLASKAKIVHQAPFAFDQRLFLADKS